MTSHSKTDAEIVEIKNALISASTLYSERPDLFKLFGSFNGKKNLLFKDKATGLVSITADSDIQKVQKEYATLISEINSCS